MQSSAKLSPCTPVDAHPAGASPFGLLDVAGSAGEWTSDLYAPNPYAPASLEQQAPARPVRLDGLRAWMATE